MHDVPGTAVTANPPSTSPPPLHGRGLTEKSGGTPAQAGIDADGHAGSVLGLPAPDGAGKLPLAAEATPASTTATRP